MNRWIPEKLHVAITAAIRQMGKAVLFTAKVTADKPARITNLYRTEEQVDNQIARYTKAAAAEGAITGAGGILLAFADFPLLLGIKIKMLYSIAAIYGFDTRDYKERLYLLYIFQLAFCSQQQRNKVYLQLANWEEMSKKLPEDVNAFDWRSFQQEYRDYIDLAKLAQMIPFSGAAVGLVVNYRLVRTLGITAKNAYRMRVLKIVADN